MPIDSGNLALKGLDDLFSTEENRQEEQREQVQQIPIDALHPFTNHPFKVLDDEAMTRTVESIAQYGVLAPLIARPRPEGDGYEIISGHRRQYAAKLAGLDTLPVIVRQMDDDAAVLLMVDSNLQRETILPSERAFAYKMKLEAMKHQAGRPTQDNYSPVGNNFGTLQGTLQMLFDRQYILTEDVVVETRYRTETDTWTDEDVNSHTDTYQVPYDYYICTVTLENFDLSHVPVYVMGEDQLSRYAIYMATLGNRPDLFPDSPYVNKYITGKPGDYEVPGEYLDDETFAAMLAEAQKYIGYPYGATCSQLKRLGTCPMIGGEKKDR